MRKLKKNFGIAIVLLGILAVPLVYMLLGGNRIPSANSTDQQTENDVPESKVASKYVDLKYPTELSDLLLHEQDIYEGRVTDAFYMKHEQKDIPLFRFDFGDENAGEWLGLLKTEDGDICITTMVFMVDDEEFEKLSEEDQQNYRSCMNAYSYMLEGLMAEPEFTSEKLLAVGEIREVKTTYWVFNLPSNMVVEEKNVDGTYVAVFSGEIAGEYIELYRVCVGENKADSELGSFKIDGRTKPISVGTGSFTEKPYWSEDDYAAAYRMMDTINHVIDMIMESEAFSMEAA